jgi:nicotinamidase-related amidase
VQERFYGLRKHRSQREPTPATLDGKVDAPATTPASPFSDFDSAPSPMGLKAGHPDHEGMSPERGLQPRKVSAGRAAVLVLDLISDFEFPDGPRVRRALAARATAIRRLLARARANRLPVIYANDNIGRWRSDAPALIARCTHRSRPGASLVRSLKPEDSDYIVLKPRHSAFFGTPLMALLDEKRIDTLVMLGVSAESCVWMTACDAHTRSLRLIVPADTVAGASSRDLRATLTSLHRVLGARTPERANLLRFHRGKVR